MRTVSYSPHCAEFRQVTSVSWQWAATSRVTENKEERAAGPGLDSVSMFWSHGACADRDSRQLLARALRCWPRDRPRGWVTGWWRRRGPVPGDATAAVRDSKTGYSSSSSSSVVRICKPGLASPGRAVGCSLDGVTQWLSLNDGLVFNCRPWWAQLAVECCPVQPERQNLFADNLLLGPLVLSRDPEALM